MSKKSRSKLWFLVHSWLALPIWFFVLIVCVTGTLAVVSKEIMWLAYPEMRATAPTDDAERLSFQQIKDHLDQKNPDATLGALFQPDGDYFALNATLTLPGGRSTIAYINPYSGEIQGYAPDFDFRRFTRALHGWWLVPFTNGYPWGWYLVAFLGLPMLASLVTGLVVYKRFWKGFFNPVLRLRHGARIFWGDLHRLSGIWSIWFIATISITGTWFLIQAILSDNQISISSYSPVTSVITHGSVPLTADGNPPPMVSLDQVLKVAQDKVPSLDASNIFLPSNTYGTLQVAGRSWYPLMAQSVNVHPYTGEVTSSRLLSDRTPLEFVTESMRPLHTGDFGGFWIKAIWAFFGLVLSVMVLSGLLIWSKRTALATAAALKRETREARKPRNAEPLENPS
ncbi:PepSY domain-containing protein [Pseudomonas sp. 148P]|uniref:PepSY domain-containing protein n=1 Tax=Pseudomonas ulcerans TaxID=3115852 RepID=A0ABU7HYG9_9PSED|nr:MULTISPECIES: PepSY domain-containing protein [unclassified Pseudomonas]MEE1925817.1 PepSY domain-containing protein [Pseudomonas sp. 147P]MEE1936589.1 PepSY domain-containing protein [Pseudomonas sp. 148P]